MVYICFLHLDIFSYNNMKYCNLTSILVVIVLIPFSLSSQTQSRIRQLEAELAKAEGKAYWETKVNLARAYSQVDPGKTLEMGSSVEVYATETGNTGLLEKALITKAAGYHVKSMLKESLACCREALVLNKTTGNLEEMEFALNLMSLGHQHLGDLTRAIETAEQVLKIRQDRGDTLRMAASLSNLAPMYMKAGQYPKAQSCLLKALRIYEQRNDTLGVVGRLQTVVQLMRRSGRTDSIRPYLFKALRLSRLAGYDFQMAELQSTYASFLKSNNQIDSAIVYEEAALEVFRRVKSPESIGQSLINLGELYSHDGLTLDGKRFFWEGIAIFSQASLIPEINFAFLAYANQLHLAGQPDSVVWYLKQAYRSALNCHQSIVIQKAAHLLYRHYREASTPDSALKYLEVYSTVSDTLAGESARKRIAELEVNYETLKKEKQITQLTLEQQIHQRRIQFLWLLVLSLLAAATLTTVTFLLKRRKDRLISLQQVELHQKEQALMAAEIEKQKLQEEELLRSLEYKSRQLSSHALHIMQKNTLLQEIQEGVEQLGSQADQQQTINKILSALNQSLRSDKDWELFRLYFEEIHPGFFEKLQAVGTDLTSNDLKLCALIRQNMTSKEMAAVLNLSPLSIKSSRYRLKKKLNLDPESDLEMFIRQL